ncbi:hypothetical protein J6590_093471 [Homalodisca vitripennis]|nr:hypothetical protein J6590_093471 [Homalodisca vitripennis]
MEVTNYIRIMCGTISYDILLSRIGEAAFPMQSVVESARATNLEREILFRRSHLVSVGTSSGSMSETDFRINIMQELEKKEEIAGRKFST